MVAMVKPVLPVFDYVVNHDYIVEFLCINQDKPELNCDGKCYLMQQLEAQKEEKKQNLPAIDLQEYPIGFVSFVAIVAVSDAPKILKKTISYSNQYSFLTSYSYFHPPSVS